MTAAEHARLVHGAVAAVIPRSNEIVCFHCIAEGPERSWSLRWLSADELQVPHCPRCRRSLRQPLTVDAASDLADRIRTTAGWTVIEVRGERPQLPLRSRPYRAACLMQYRIRPRRTMPPTIAAITPSGRRVTISSEGRWRALHAREGTPTD